MSTNQACELLSRKMNLFILHELFTALISRNSTKLAPVRISHWRRSMANYSKNTRANLATPCEPCATRTTNKSESLGRKLNSSLMPRFVWSFRFLFFHCIYVVESLLESECFCFRVTDSWRNCVVSQRNMTGLGRRHCVNSELSAPDAMNCQHKCLVSGHRYAAFSFSHLKQTSIPFISDYP